MTLSTLTTSNGNPVPVAENQTSQTAGPDGPVLLQDFHLIDKLAHFDRERIPERVVHAKGAGAHGVFKVTHDVTQYSKAAFLSEIGKETPVFARFSTVGGEKGSADTARDPRGFAVKFYTEEGNWDMVGNNTPVFFIRDPSKFPDFIHTQKRNPQTNLRDAHMFWDFLTLVPESIHQVTILFSDRGTPDGYRHMNGYSSHTFKLIDAKGTIKYCKWHFKTDQGIKNLTDEEARTLVGVNPDYATQDLFDSIEKGQYPSWSVFIQVMDPCEVAQYAWNIFDVTKVWPHKDYPLIPVGKLTLNKNPQNYFAETEQAAFSPSHVVPGIEPSEDRMLQGRLFSYPDTHRHRLGVNYTQLPINAPYRAKVHNHQRDGSMAFTNFGSLPNYEPNSVHPPQDAPFTTTTVTKTPDLTGYAGRFPYERTSKDYEQAGNLYRLWSEESKQRFISNIAGHVSAAPKEIQVRVVEYFCRADKDIAERLGKALKH